MPPAGVISLCASHVRTIVAQLAGVCGPKRVRGRIETPFWVGQRTDHRHRWRVVRIGTARHDGEPPRQPVSSQAFLSKCYFFGARVCRAPKRDESAVLTKDDPSRVTLQFGGHTEFCINPGAT